jgi:phospholipid-binding lipoprotein MlaA
MLPLLGPSNVRDGVGLGVDAIFHPTFFLLGGTDVLFFSGSSGLTERARVYEELKALQESSIDYYAALRSGYYQNRQSEIWKRREDRRPDDQAAFQVSTASALTRTEP